MIPFKNLRRFVNKVFRQPGYALRVLCKRVIAYWFYSFSQGKSSYPESITLFLTHRCNLRCKMCGQWGEGGITKRQNVQYIQEELTLNELKSIIDDISSFKPNITLFGGESLLHPDCIEIIRYIKQKQMHCLIITNGYLLEELAQDLVDSGLDELNVSLDGASALHDQIRGMPGLFNKIMQGLKKIENFKTQKGKKKPLINLQCTITQYNYMYLEQSLDVANEVKANSLTFHNLIFLDKGIMNRQKEYDKILNCSSSDWNGFIFAPGIDPKLLYEKIKRILAGKYSFSVDFYPNFSSSELKEYYESPGYFPSGNSNSCRCISPWIVAYIFPDAQVRPCLNFDYAYGNIKNNKFSKIWNSEKAIGYRKLLKEKKIFPVCLRCTELYRY